MKAYLIAANAKRMLDSICIVAVILLTSCGGNSPVSITLKPTPTDITEAVRNSVSAKTYTEIHALISDLSRLDVTGRHR